jgi:hypothetical protein
LFCFGDQYIQRISFNGIIGAIHPRSGYCQVGVPPEAKQVFAAVEAEMDGVVESVYL